MVDLPKSDTDFLSHKQPMQNRDAKATNIFTRFEKKEVEQSIVDRFEKQVVIYPNRIAVKTNTHQFTYDALNKAANRIARAILALCGEGEEPIALLLEQGAPMLAAILGVLKAGKIYVPLDPALPEARATYILENSQAGLMVTNSQNQSLARELTQSTIQVLSIDEIDTSISDENLGLSISPDNFAYIIYTSGSTGQPKGVVENHRNVLHEVMNRTNEISICPDDRLCIFQSFSFAGSIRKIYPVLLNGASLYPLDIKKEGIVNMANWLTQEEITILGGRAVIRELFSTLTGKERFPKIRLVTFGGDSIYRSDIESSRRHLSPDIMSVGLAGTEFGTAARYTIHKDTPISDGVLPVGYPVEGKKFLLLDDAGNQVGPGQIGEIAVKSRYLSPGYWRRPDLTQARFLPDPEGGDERIYLTGDMGRMMPDGCLIHMGRKDFQVKIRGYRIETAEVEAALLELDTINRAIVVAREERPGHKRLVAYLIPSKQPAPTVTALRSALAKTLPDYMIPSAFVMMDEMPFTATSKVDRMALPEPDTTRPELDVDFIAPRDEMESRLAGIWEEILDIDSIGVRDNFFDLGGHSLLAVQVFDRIKKSFGRKLPLVALLHAPTIEQLAHVLRQKEWSPPVSSLVTLQSHGSKRPLFCVHACNGEVLFYTDLARHLGQDRPFYGLRAQGLEGKQPPHNRIEDMAAHYVREIQTVQPEGPYFLGGGGVGGMIAFEMAQQLLAQNQKIGLLILMDTAPPRPVSSIPVSTGSRKSLGHYVSRSFYYLWNRQLIFVLKSVIQKHRRKIKRMLKPYNIRRVRDALDMAPWSYVPEVYPGRITYFLSEKRERTLGGPEAAIGSWYELAAGGLDEFHVPGDHLGMLKEPHVRIVAEHLNACLDEAQMDASDTNYAKVVSAKTAE